MKDFAIDIESCLRVLGEGGTILYPTDTIWGVGCDATNSEAVRKIYDIKQRADKKALIVLVANERDVLQYVTHPDFEVFTFLKLQTKPTTVVYQGATGLAESLTHDDGTVAIRICQDKFCQELINRFKKPIVSTSANISGHAPPKNFQYIDDKIKTAVDYVVSYRQQDLAAAEPSTLIKWEKGKAIILRA